MTFFSQNSKVRYATSTVVDGNLSFKWGERAVVLDNRQRFVARQGISLENTLVMQVEHEEKIIMVDSSFKNPATENLVIAEALVTKERGLTLFLLTADCLPIAFYDPINEVIALAHAGWPSTDRELAAKVVRYLTEHCKSDPASLEVVIGPCIHAESYVFENLTQKESPRWTPFLVPRSDGLTQVDLVAYNRAQLEHAGVRAEKIEVDPHDTAVSSDYFSHYRSVRTGEPEGRFATILTLS